MSERGLGMVFGLGAAALFGLSAPVSKRLLPEMGVLVLASILYLGAGVATTAVRVGRRFTRSGRAQHPEASLHAGDLPALLVVAVLGGAVAPVLMLVGLGRVSGMTGSLLLNLEAPFTIALAVALFQEHLGRLERIAAACTVAGTVVLSVMPGAWRIELVGFLAIAGACLCWAIDNNLSQRLSARDPLVVVQIKTLAAGLGSAVLAASFGERLPALRVVLVAGVLGALSYGVSLVLDMRALRLLGAAREAAIFATAPFIGAIVAVPVLGERPGVPHLVAGTLMAAGVLLLAKARHSHRHVHEALEHEHMHDHDEHHRHEHPDGSPRGPHAHPHRHEPVTHDHPHVSDAHHRHRHR